MLKNQNLDNIWLLLSKKSRMSFFIDKAHQQPWRVFYFCFLPKKLRQFFSIKAELSQKKLIADAFNELIDIYHDERIIKFNLSPKKQLSSKKIIWQYWGQGIDDPNLPEMVKICFNSVDMYKADYQVIRLDDTRVKEYLDLPDFVWKKKENDVFKCVFFSDVLRLALLDVYGGVWLDATILLTDGIPSQIQNMPFFSFQRSENVENRVVFEKLNSSYFGWKSDHYVNMLSSIIISEPKNLITHTWLDLLLNFWMTQNKIQHYFFFQIMFHELINNENYRDSNCAIFDDTIPHLLYAKLNENFDAEEFEQIKQKTNFHKMTYVKECVPNSYYDYIKHFFA